MLPDAGRGVCCSAQLSRPVLLAPTTWPLHTCIQGLISLMHVDSHQPEGIIIGGTLGGRRRGKKKRQRLFTPSGSHAFSRPLQGLPVRRQSRACARPPSGGSDLFSATSVA
eukprot:1673595-Prymnesium_polylepis.1